MGSNGLRVVLASVLLLVLSLGLLLWRMSDTVAPAIPDLARNDVVVDEPSALQPVPEDPARIVEATSARVEATATDASDQPLVPGVHLFDVTFAPVDELGRPMAGVAIELGLARHRANRMGTSDEKGELRVTYRGNEPLIDAVVSATHARRSTLLHAVRLVGGAPVLLRFCAERMPTTMNVSRHLEGGDEASRFFDAYVSPAFELDAAGNGVFTDADLIVRKIEPLPDRVGGKPSPFSTRRIGGGASRTIADGRRNHEVECVVHDAGGLALGGVPMRVFRANALQGEDARTTSEGRYKLVMPLTGSVGIEVGGGLFTRDRRTFEAGHSATWDVQLARVPSITGRLTDAEGTPVDAWRIQARCNASPHGYQHACVTDAEGRFELGLPSCGSARLIASPDKGGDIPAQRILENVTTEAGPVDMFVRSPRARVTALWHFDVPVGFSGIRPQARAMRRDSGEGILLDPCDNSEGFEGRKRFAFCLEGVLPGHYVLTNIAPGGSSTFGVSLGTERELIGNIPLDGSMEIVLRTDRVDDALWTVRATTRAQGVLVRSEVLTVPGTLIAPAGDLRLEIFTSAEGHAGGMLRDVSGIGGERIEIRLDELR